MAKGDKFYYENLAASADYAKQAASYLVKCLESYKPEEMQQMLDRMHAIEHGGDTKKHEMNAALAKAFVTPVDREDLDLLSQRIDDVTDMIEEILQKFYIFDVHTINPSAITMAQKLVHACELLCQVMNEFENFKKSKKLRQLIIEINDAEEECDKLYMASMRELSQKGGDVLETISWREIFDCMEACADACEHASDCIGSVIMKNT